MALLIGVFLVFLLLNMPIAFALLIAPTTYLLVDPLVPYKMLAQQMFNGVDSFVFLAVPFFILSGMLMQYGGISKRLVDFSSALLDRFIGGLAMAVSLAAAIFASITGSGPATTAAIGGAILPELVERGYGKEWSVALMASAGVLGPIIPPSITMVIYGAMTGTSIGALFLGGFLPGITISIGLMVISYFHAKKVGVGKAVKSRSITIGKSLIDALWALGMPFLILGGILGGIFTPTEAAVVATVYALIVCFVVYGSLKVQDLPRIFKEAAVITSVVMIILANAATFAWLMSALRGPEKLISLFYSISDNTVVLLLLINIFLLILGCFIDTSSALVMTVPTFMPLIEKMGVDPVHFGLIVCINLIIGMATPPLGITLFTACSIGKVPISKVAGPLLPMLAIMIFVLIIVTYVPSFVLFLPKLLM